MRLPVGVIHSDERLLMTVVVPTRRPYDEHPTGLADSEIVHTEAWVSR